MAGYNTTVEILRSGRPGLLVPRRGPSAEQRLRAELFAARGWVRRLDPETLDRATVAAAAVGAGAVRRPPSRGPQPTPDLSGSAVAAAALIGLLDESGGTWSAARGAAPAVAAGRAVTGFRDARPRSPPRRC